MALPVISNVNSYDIPATLLSKEELELVSQVDSTLLEEEKYIYNPYIGIGKEVGQLQTNVYVNIGQDSLLGLEDVEEDLSYYNDNYDINIRIPFKKSITVKAKLKSVSKGQLKPFID